ncbi:hypothetical protein Q3G72_030299 [Acer saccharum]|nr:hypothetical protein Q3G72_030299 [Acer saccharum]
MSSKWRDEQHPSFIDFISSFLTANSFRLNFILIAPDLIFNCGGLYGMQLGRPTFLPVQDIEMGFEKIVKIAHCRDRGRKSYSPKLLSSMIVFK